MKEPKVLWEAGEVRLCKRGDRRVLFARGNEDANDENFIAWRVDGATAKALRACITRVLGGEAPINPEYEGGGNEPLLQSGVNIEGEATVLEFKFGVFGTDVSRGEGAKECELHLIERFDEEDYRLAIHNMTGEQAEELLKLLG